MKNLAAFWLCAMFGNATLLGAVLKSTHHLPPCPNSNPADEVVFVAMGPLTWAVMAGYAMADEVAPFKPRECR